MDGLAGAELCGCCEPAARPTPAVVENRPGLGAVAYRIGTFAAFREAMLEALARQPALRGLTARRGDDPAITVLELWAAVADVLTFYQERIANESFLRTARERDSVLRLARLLDYHLRPGLAATARLAFSLDEGATATIPVGLRVMSVPGQDEQPIFFETVEAIRADARLNRLPILPEPTVVNPLAQGRLSAFLTPDNAGWVAAAELRATDKVVLFGGFDSAAAPPAPSSAPTYGESLGWGMPTHVVPKKKAYAGGQKATIGESLAFWESGMLELFGPTSSFVPGDAPDAPEEKEIREIRVEGDRYLLVWTTGVVKSGWTAETNVRVFTRKMRVFGYDAPETFATVTSDPDAEDPADQVTWTSHHVHPVSVSGSTLALDAVYSDLVVGDELLIYDSGASPSTRVVTITALSDGEAVVPSTMPGASLADHRYRATVTRASVTPDVDIADVRAATVYRLKGPPIPLWTGDFPHLIASGRLCLPALRLDSTGESLEIGRTIVGGALQPGVALNLDEIEIGRSVLLQDHARRPILATIANRQVATYEGQDFLVIDVNSLSAIQLETSTAELLGNVALATHGQTVRDEVLGDGDAAMPFQRFSLKKKPLTYVPSATSASGQSTLRLLANGERWTQVPSLYGQPPEARVFTARQSDDGTTVIQGGDGTSGARFPTGRGNLVATYREGSGLAGRVRADQLSILLDRPVGVSGVANPAPADGGADPETLDSARQAAPTTVKTFGRAISLLDFETLAMASGEVARAKATWVWRGLEKAVHLTVAGQQAGVFSDEALRTLHGGLTSQRDPNHPLLVANVVRAPVVVAASIKVDDRHVRATVEAAAREALRGYFAFENLGFAQPLHLSAIYSAIQRVPGVAWVDVDLFHFKGYADWSAGQLAARGATAAPVQEHLRIFAARLRPGPTAPVDPVAEAWFGTTPLPDVLPAEQAFIAVESTDLALTFTGGLG